MSTEKTLFACDLDNTLLVSARDRREGDITAELLNGREQSFLAPAVCDMLRSLNEREDIVFLPVTSRSCEQYRRITLPITPAYALICNGTALLRDGETDSSWEEYFAPIIQPSLPEAKELLARYAGTPEFTSFRIVDGRFLFAACTDSVAAGRLYARMKGETTLDLMLSGRKLYWFPPGADKGTAVKRFAQLHGCTRIIAAGDSEIDLPMLDIADTAAVPAALADKVACDDVRVCCDGRFSEFIAEMMLSS